MTCNTVVGDIFDTQNCYQQYLNCGSSDKIQVFMWQQIQKIQTFCNNFSHTQNMLNNEFSGNIADNKNSIALIKRDVDVLKALCDSLSTSQTQLYADYNAFKLAVDSTLVLYQSTINSVVRNVDALTVANQALENRVGVLESELDLAKLQDIIKSWELIKNDFTAQLNNAVDTMHTFIEADLSLVRDEYKAADAVIVKAYTSMDEVLLNGYKDADALISRDYKAADAGIIDQFTKADSAISLDYKAADAAIIKRFAAADDAISVDYKAADAAIIKRFVAADDAISVDYKDADAYIIERFTNADIELEKGYKAGDAVLSTKFNIFESSVNNELTEFEKSVNKELTAFELNVTKQMSELTTIVSNNSLEMARVAQAFIDLDAQLSAFKLYVESRFTSERAYTDKHVSDCYDLSVIYTDDEIVKVEVRITELVLSYQRETTTFINDMMIKMHTSLDAFDVRLNVLRVELTTDVASINTRIDGLNNYVGEHFEKIKADIRKLFHESKTNYDLAYDAKRTSNAALEIATQASKKVDDYDKQFKDFAFDITRIDESLAYIDSDLVRGVFDNTIEALYNIRIATMSVKDDVIRISNVSSGYKIIGRLNEARDVDGDTEFEEVAVNTFYDFRIVSDNPNGVRSYIVELNPMSETSTLVRVRIVDNEFSKAYYGLELMIDGEELTGNVNIHPTPAKPLPPEDVCKPMHIMLVNKHCEEINLSPQPGRDGRDGAGITSITLNVDEDLT